MATSATSAPPFGDDGDAEADQQVGSHAAPETDAGDHHTRDGFDLLVRYGRLHPRTLGAAILGGVVFGVTLVASTAVLGALTDDLIIPAFDDGVDRRDVWLGAGLFLAVTTIRSLAAVARRWFGAKATRKIGRTQRERIGDRYLGVPLSYHQATPTGELLAHADTDIEVSSMIMNMVPMSIGTIALVVVAAIQIAVIDPVLLGVAVLVFPALAIANRVYTVRVHEPAALVQQRLGEVSALAHESFDGALVVKALGREAAEVARMRERSERLRQTRLEVGRLRAVFEPGIEAIPNLGVIALLAVGTWRISAGAMSTGDLVAVAALFSVLTFPVRVFGFLLEELPRAMVAEKRLAKVLVVPDGPIEPQEPVSLPHGPLSLDFDNVTFAFSDPLTSDDAPLDDPSAEKAAGGTSALPAAGPTILQEVSFRVEPGEVVALVGPTGGGKSTLVNLALRLTDVESGTVKLGDVDVRRVDSGEIRESTALVFQESFLFADSVDANITLAKRGDSTPDGASAGFDLEARDRATRIARAAGFIADLPEGYETVLGERGVTLSGGQRQRVALARALYRRPRLVILDDATSAVDPVIEAEILSGLRSDSGTTMLIVAHRLSTIELADRVIFLVDGRVQAVDTHAALLDDPDYASLVNAYGDPR